MLNIVFVLFLSIITVADCNGAPTQFVRIVDGDTLVINNEKIRLFGIDAPERTQECFNKKGRGWSCGESATAFLEGLIIGRDIKCKIHKMDKYKRSLGICLADGINLNQELVRAGYAVAYIRYSSEYKIDELYARENKKGIWSGTFELPEVYRKRRS
jgi:endonuclease YncB( thermonuclease family)